MAYGYDSRYTSLEAPDPNAVPLSAGELQDLVRTDAGASAADRLFPGLPSRPARVNADGTPKTGWQFVKDSFRAAVETMRSPAVWDMASVAMPAGRFAKWGRMFKADRMYQRAVQSANRFDYVLNKTANAPIAREFTLRYPIEKYGMYPPVTRTKRVLDALESEAGNWDVIGPAARQVGAKVAAVPRHVGRHWKGYSALATVAGLVEGGRRVNAAFNRSNAAREAEADRNRRALAGEEASKAMEAVLSVTNDPASVKAEFMADPYKYQGLMQRAAQSLLAAYRADAFDGSDAQAQRYLDMYSEFKKGVDAADPEQAAYIDSWLGQTTGQTTATDAVAGEFAAALADRRRAAAEQLQREEAGK